MPRSGVGQQATAFGVASTATTRASSISGNGKVVQPRELYALATLAQTMPVGVANAVFLEKPASIWGLAIPDLKQRMTKCHSCEWHSWHTLTPVLPAGTIQ